MDVYEEIEQIFKIHKGDRTKALEALEALLEEASPSQKSIINGAIDQVNGIFTRRIDGFSIRRS